MEGRDVSGGCFKEGERGEGERKELEGRKRGGNGGRRVFTTFNFNNFPYNYKCSLFINNSYRASSQVKTPRRWEIGTR